MIHPASFTRIRRQADIYAMVLELSEDRQIEAVQFIENLWRQQLAANKAEEESKTV